MPKRIEIQQNELIDCACGCGQTLLRWHKYARGKPVERHYIHGHNANGNVTVSCATCGKDFRVSPSKLKISARLFCSRECCNTARRQQQTVICSHCGIAFDLPPNRIEGTKHFYCSQKCRNLQEERCCIICGKSVLVHRFRASQERVYCSRACQHVGLSRFNARENNATWKGGRVPTRGTNWGIVRRTILDRDDYRCRLCGSYADLHVHHLTPVRYFAAPETANDAFNLVTLCRSCHGRAEDRKHHNPLNDQLRTENILLFS